MAGTWANFPLHALNFEPSLLPRFPTDPSFFIPIANELARRRPSMNYTAPSEIRNSAPSREPSRFLKELFNLIDREIEELDDNSMERFSLIWNVSDLYWKTFTGLKSCMGTSSGWPWFGEYVIFHLIRYKLRRLFPTHVLKTIKYRSPLSKDAGTTKDVWVYGLFENQQGIDELPYLILAHNAKFPKIGGYRADISILSRSMERLAVIEVKIDPVNGDTIPNALQNLANVSTNPKCLRFLVILERNGSFHEEKLEMAMKAMTGKRYGVVALPGGTLQENLKTAGISLMPLQECLTLINSRINGIRYD